jgi:diguanylate cyclase (GGDEF)-like protein
MQVEEAAHGRIGRFATVVVPSVLTAAAFAVASHFGDVGNLPLWALLTLLGLVGLEGEATGLLVRADSTRRALHAALSTQVLGITAVIYVIGWGPTLTIGYVFVAARALDTAGSRVWRIALGWTVVGILVGQAAIVIGLVPTYVAAPYVHGLAALGILGMAFVMRLLGRKTEENEQTLVQRDRADREVRTTLGLLSATLDSTADGILVVDAHGAITRFNAQFATMWRLPRAVLDSRDDDAAIQFVLDQLVRPEAFIAKVEELYADPEAESDDTLEFQDGRVFDRHSRPQRVDGVVVGRVWSFRDVTDRSRLVDELEHQAFHDHLTGLGNRALLRDRLEHALSRSRRSGATVTVLFCDLDRFKIVNDTLGHDAGDALLVAVARCLTQHVRDGDTAARVGGDEFALVLDQTTARDAIALAHRLLDALREPFDINGREIFARASIGIADNWADALDGDELLARADIAMYSAKSHGRDRFEVFEPTMQTDLTTHSELHDDLRRAVQHGELTLHYQPLIDLETNAIDSLEALVRWNHPTRGFVGPDDFIPIAEETGLIIDLGRFVLREACRQIMAWRTLPNVDQLRIGVNVSSHQLYDDQFVDDVRAILEESGLPATSLILELTESALLADTSSVHHRLHALKSLGVRIAIDDFGTGYSSLAYLHSFSVDYLKIDRGFITALTSDNSQARDMVRAIIGIGHNLKLGVIAEGIEETNQLEELRNAGCNTGQGFLFARPVPPERIPELLIKHRRRGASVEPATFEVSLTRSV